MKSRKTTSSAQIEHAVGKAVNFEVTVADLARKSERRAWWVAGTSVVMSMMLAGGYFYFLPLKEKVPYLVMADAYTGTATVARLRGDWNNNQITASEAINKSNVANYVLARESFDLALLQLRDWDTVFAMSEAPVATEYRRENEAANPASPYKVYGKTKVVRVKILSIQLVGDPSKTPTGATVRFQRTLYDKSNGSAQPLPTRFATMAFRYDPLLKFAEATRLLNPLAFRVTSYRVENEMINAPPLEVARSTGPDVDTAATGGVLAPGPGMSEPASVDGASLEAAPGMSSAPAPGMQPATPTVPAAPPVQNGAVVR